MATDVDLNDAARRLIPFLTAVAVVQPRMAPREPVVTSQGRGIITCLSCGQPLRDHPLTSGCNQRGR